jgi:hypothetical protein
MALAASQALVQGCGKAKPSGAAVTEADGGAGNDGANPSAEAGDTKRDEPGNGGLDGSNAILDVAPEADPKGPILDCDKEPERCALCSGKYSTISLHYTETIRGTWQYDPGGVYVTLAAPGYPCSAFLHDGAVRPTLDDDRWVGAPQGDVIAFSTASTLTASDYRSAQFRYFRSLVFVPASVQIDSFRVTTTGVDDSVHLVLYNSKYPNGISPADAGPSDPDVGACAGNGDSSWDFKGYAQAGEINVVLIVQADMSPTVCALGKADITVNSSPIPLFDCVTGIGPTIEPGPESPDAAGAEPAGAEPTDANASGAEP